MARDINQLGKSIVGKATAEKNPSAVALGKLGGLVGGHARAEKLSKRQRVQIAKKAAQSRWKHHRKLDK